MAAKARWNHAGTSGVNIVELSELSQHRGEWLRGNGPDADIVMSSRIRLARNLARFPFLSRADDRIRREIEQELRGVLKDVRIGSSQTYCDVTQLKSIDRQFLVERQLISRELSENEGARGVCFANSETASVMVNEEDHLRLQVFRSGFALDDCWDEITRIDDELEERVSYAFSPEFGYLTACPTNVGTGIRVSVLLHLPALVMTKEIQKVFQAAQKISLAVRGLYGEGSQAMGDFYQFSNQITLGKSEQDVMGNLKSVIPSIIAYEKRCRFALVKENREKLHDQVSRAIGVLRTAQTITSEETMQLLSSVRMGVYLELIDSIDLPVLNELFLNTQPAHLQRRENSSLTSAEHRNSARAGYIRKRLLDLDQSSN